MEVSPLRALTLQYEDTISRAFRCRNGSKPVEGIDTLCHDCCSPFILSRRNGSKPVEGIDTSSSPSITTLFISVEMEVSPLRALTRLWLKYVGV